MHAVHFANFIQFSFNVKCIRSYSHVFRAMGIKIFITRDDVVSQRLKFGSTFLSSSWESKIALFFNFPVSRARPEKLCGFLLAATSKHVQVRLDCTSRKKILRQQRREK